MKIGVYITARLGSKRLKNKHLIEVNGHPILYYLLKRIKHHFFEEISEDTVKIIIVTTDEEENNAFETFTTMDVVVFYGSRHNIPLRHLQAAEAFSLDAIISVDGDDIFCSPKAIRAVYESLMDKANYVVTEGLPLGMNAMGYSTAFLRQSVSVNPAEKIETGWGRVFDDRQKKVLPISVQTFDSLLRFTLDYYEDLLFFKAIIENLGPQIIKSDDNKIIKVVDENRFSTINRIRSEEYWLNFRRQVHEEMS